MGKIERGVRQNWAGIHINICVCVCVGGGVAKKV